MNRPRLFPALLAALFVAGAVVQSASCTLDTNGSNQTTEPPKPCQTSADCDDMNPCTNDSCNDQNVCAHQNAMNGPLATQEAGDCKRTDCSDGEPLVVNDDADKPNDNEPCTTDACSSGSPSHTPLADGQMCLRGTQSGTCQMGTCQISCSPQNPCNDNNPCTDEYCNAATSTCVFTNIDGLPTPGAMQTTEDCKVNLCVNGIDSVVNDDGDIPIDDNPCTDDVCAAGVPSNPPVGSGTYCQVGQLDVCDGNGACVECTLPEHCVNIVETDCIQRSCVANKCMPKYLDQSVTAAMQVVGDCQKNVCNGTDGGTVSIADNSDLPNDNNACTSDTCNSGAPKYTNVPQGTNCGGVNVCNANGGCVGCNAPTDCAGTDDFCKQRTCTNNVCGWSYKANNTPLQSGQTSQDCKILVCDGNGNTVTKTDSTDTLPDGNTCTKDQCSAGGSPTYSNESFGFSCDMGAGEVCNGMGACKKPQGGNCAANADCANNICADGACCDTTCSGTCKACNIAGKVGTCSNVAKNTNDGMCMGTTTCDGNGACKAVDGQGCSMNGQCVNGNCIDSICCENACSGTCKACNVPGNLGKCTNIPSGGQDSNPANACTGTNQCDGTGVCKKSNGQNCPGGTGDCVSGNCADGICCDSACTGTCKACNVMGSVGTCTNVPSGQDDANGMAACTGLSSCNGSGVCKGDQGQTCPGGNGDCLNNTCADGYCCDTTCTGTCKACNVAGSLGTCSNVPSGQDDANAMMACMGGTVSCDNGLCKGENGQTCSNGTTDCLSGNCVDGVCCDSTCTGTCKACNVMGSVGTCTNVPNMQTDNTCNGMGQQCDGAGNCKKANGQGCSVVGDCLSGNCIDGVCCGTACTTACYTCNGAMPGTCSPITTVGAQDNTPANACTGTNACDGAGACLFANGETCMNNGQCASGNCSTATNPKTCAP